MSYRLHLGGQASPASRLLCLIRPSIRSLSLPSWLLYQMRGFQLELRLINRVLFYDLKAHKAGLSTAYKIAISHNKWGNKNLVKKDQFIIKSPRRVSI